MIFPTKHEGCICTRKHPVAFLIFHTFVSFLFLRKPTVFVKKQTRIVCRPTRQATETIIRSISYSLPLRLKSNESKKYADKTLKLTFGYYNFLNSSEQLIFIQKNAVFIQVLIYQDQHNQLLNTINFINFYYLISKNLSLIT